MDISKKILVTGAAGYIGKHVVQELVHKGYEVIASDYVKGDDADKVTWITIPIFDVTSDLFEQLGSPDVLIHLAWQDGFVHNSAAHMNNLAKHIAFLNHMIDSGISNISVMGTMHEIGYWEGMIEENTPCNPLNQYGVAKNALRQSVMLYAQGKETKVNWLRAFYITGDDKRGNSVFSKILDAEDRGVKVFPFTSGKNKYDFITIRELAEMIVAASVQTEFSGIINVCSGMPISLAERVESFIKDKNLSITLEYGAFPDRAYDSPGVWGDASIIQKIMKLN